MRQHIIRSDSKAAWMKLRLCELCERCRVRQLAQGFKKDLFRQRKSGSLGWLTRAAASVGERQPLLTMDGRTLSKVTRRSSLRLDARLRAPGHSR
jgi:hypothetical protein